MITEEKSLPLRQVSQQIAKRTPFWVQGTGGNSSWKDGEHLWIKATGKRMDQISQPLGLAGVHLNNARQSFTDLRLHDDFDQGYNDLIEKNRVKDGRLGRPSHETGFHVLLPRPWVFHFHALSSLLLENDKNDPEVKKLLSNSPLKFCFIDSVKPGFLLTKAIAEQPNFDVFILKNHGLILHGEQSDIVNKWAQFEIPYLRLKFGEDKLKFRDMGWLEIVDTLGSSEGPFKTYLPDAVTHEKELKKFLKPGKNGHYSLPDNAEGMAIEDVRARNMVEIWTATLALHHFHPKLAEIQA